jgi:uncharacterized protein (UPF0147 family)
MNLKLLTRTPPWEWPDEAGPLLREVLADDRATEGDRLLAAQLAGDLSVVNDEMVAALLATLRNARASQQVRGAAAISLGPTLEDADTNGFDEVDEPAISEPTFATAVSALQDLYRDTTQPRDVRRRVLEAAVRSPQDWQPAAIREAYASGDPLWQTTAVFCMRYVRGFAGTILEALHSKDPEIHRQAVLAAGAWELQEAWPHVEELVTARGTSKPLLLAAIEAVAGIKPEEAPETLEHLADARDDEIAEAVEDALSLAQSSAALDGDD